MGYQVALCYHRSFKGNGFSLISNDWNYLLLMDRIFLKKTLIDIQNIDPLCHLGNLKLCFFKGDLACAQGRKIAASSGTKNVPQSVSAQISIIAHLEYPLSRYVANSNH